MEPVCVIYRGTGGARARARNTQNGLIKISLEPAPPLSLFLSFSLFLSPCPYLHGVRSLLGKRFSIRGCSPVNPDAGSRVTTTRLTDN